MDSIFIPEREPDSSRGEASEPVSPAAGEEDCLPLDDAAQLQGREGVVLVDVTVLPDGSVGSVHLASDAGYPRLGAAALAKVKLATFKPALVNGSPVVGYIRIPYPFMLE
jgi:TonB family protein